MNQRLDSEGFARSRAQAQGFWGGCWSGRPALSPSPLASRASARPYSPRTFGPQEVGAHYKARVTPLSVYITLNYVRGTTNTGTVPLARTSDV
jgi:hypothetical protein